MKIKKSTKRVAAPPTDVAAVVDKIANSTNDDDIIPILNDISIWRYQRADLHAWVPALDRFDDVLANIIQGYDLGKLQTNEFTPTTKELLMGVLRLTRLMLENCTSRKLYASYERLADLLFTTDLDVLHSTLLLFLRPGQQYGSGTPMDAPVIARVTNRLLTLTKGWEQYEAHDAVRLVSSDVVEPASTKITLQFYPEEGSSSSISTLELDVSQLQTADQIAEVADKHKISVDDQLALLNKARVLSSGREARQQLYAIRLLAIATYVYYTPEDASQSSIFLYETTLVNQLAQLLVPGRGVGDGILSAALYAIDACAHHKNKLSEVVAAIGANVTHGVLISLTRDTVRRLTANEDVSFEVVDALMGLVAFVATSPPHSNQIIGAGIIPLLLEIPKTTVEKRVNYIARTMGLIDAIIFSAAQGLTAFVNADGCTTLVKTVKSEIDILWERTLPEPTYALSEDTIKSYYTIPIKSTLRSIQRLMQVSGGAEGMRNLVDSDLPKLLKQIFINAPRFGPRVFALAINTMASFVHNEPTSLSVLQELGLPQALYTQLEQEFPTTYDIVGVIPNAIGAICLNQAGIDYTLAHPTVIEKLVTLSASSDHAHHLGQSLDELVRHHPPLRPLVLAGLLSSLRGACKEGAAFVPKDEEEGKRYLLTDTDVVGELSQPADNEPLRKLVMILNVLQGVLRNSTLAKEFIDGGGLDLLLDIADLPCIPMQAGHAPSGISVATITVFSTLGEHDQARIAKALVQSVRVTMDKVPDMWKGDGEWIGLGDKLPILRGLVIRLAYLSNFFAAVSAGSSKSATPLLKVLCDSEQETFIHDVGLLHRKTMLSVANFRVHETPKEGGSPEETQGSGGKYLSTRLYMGLTKMFKSFVRLLFFKRTPEPAHRTQAKDLANRITDVLLGHCDFAKTVEEPNSICGPVGVCYNTVALGASLLQLFDDRGHEGHLHMVLFIAFEKRGGLGKLLELVSTLLDNVERPGLEGADKTRAAGGITVALETLSAFVRPKAIMSNSQTHVLQQRTEANFSPTEMFIRIRREIFPHAKRVWDSDWIQNAPVKVAQKGVKSFLTIVEGKDEVSQSSQPLQPRSVVGIPTIPAVRAPVVADPTAVAQLVDMGFARGSAEQALIRARNNVAAATEMILSMPHVFDNAPAAPAPAPAEPVTTQEPLVVDGAEGDAAEGASTETAPATVADEMEIDESPLPAPTESAEEVKKALDDMRAQEKPNLPTRAMALLSGDDALMFDLIPAFPADESALTLLLKNFSVKDDEKVIANKLRLFSILAVAHQIPELSDENTTMAYSIIKSLPIDTKPRPTWLTSLLCFAETIMVLSINVKTVKVGEPAESNTEIARIEEQERLLSACRGILADEATQTEIVTAYRLMVVISKYNKSIDFADCLAPFKLKLDARLSTCHQLLAMILRHGFEDRSTLDDVMQSEIRAWFNRDKVTEVGHFVRQLRQATSRHSDAFVDCIEKECALIDPTPVAGVYHIRAKGSDQATKSSDPFSGSASHPTMELLVKELGSATKDTLGDEAVAEGYSGLIFSLLTEVTGSYISAKKAFMDALRETGTSGPKARNGISPIVNDLVACVELGRDLATDGQKGVKPTRRMVISGWATSMLVALCSDITPVAKNVSEDLAIIRRTVLDAIVKVIKDSSAHEANVRYGKLWAVGELVYRLLTSKPGIAPRDDSSLQIAKAMVEKNFVGLMTDAMGGVDLNFPNIKVPLLSLLKALDHLSKISIKWNKVEKKTDSGGVPGGARAGSSSSSSSGSESDIGMDDIIDEETPDLYRNSALGILGGEMEDESGDEDEDDDGDDDMLDFYDENDMEDDDEAGTEPSDTDGMDDDENMDGEEEEWTDEDEDGEDEEMDQEVVIGTEEPGAVWDQDGAAIDADDVPFDLGDDGPMPEMGEEMEAYLDGMLGDEMLGDEGDDDDEEDMLDGPEDFELEGDGDEDEELLLDDMDEMGDAEIVVNAPAATAGHWGWSTDPRAGRSDRPRSRLMMDSDHMSALFGPPRSTTGSQSLVVHPLLNNPAYAEADRLASSPFAAVPNPDGLADTGGSMADRMGPDAARLVESVLTRHREAGRQALSIGMSAGLDGGIAIDIGGRRYTFPPPSQQSHSDPAADAEVNISAEFIPKPTLQRWYDEMAVCGDDSVKLVNHIINRLLPEAKVRAAAEAEKTKKLEAEAKEAEEKAQEEARKVGAEKAKEEEEARKADAAAAAEVALPESRNPTPSNDVDMEAVVEAPTEPETDTTTQQAAEEAGPSTTEEPAPVLERTIISIHGRDVDITGTGIDLEFLQALPDEMRADVVEQHMREHNRNRDTVPDTSGSSQISPEFLDALPDEIRSEVMLQEQMERARRARAQAETQTAQPPAGAPPTSADADGLAEARRQLLERRQRIRNPPAGLAAAAAMFGVSEEGALAGLGDEIDQVMDLIDRSVADGAPNPFRHALGQAAGLGRPRPAGATAPEPPHKRAKRDAVQLLDKPGVASLVRLLFFTETFKKDYLFRVLVNLCENSSTRTDLLNLLISVVQDGTGDLLLVDKSFSLMTLKPGVTPKSTPKTPKLPDTPAPQPSPSNLFAKMQADHIPTFIAQRCFEALTHIVAHNSMAVNFFLTEHEQPVGLRKPLSKKGKGKEKLIPQTKFPIVVLLGFLDRSVLLKAPGMMESFTLLLSATTKPLATLKFTDTKEDKEDKPASSAASAAAAAPAVAGDAVAGNVAQTPRPVATPAKEKVGESSTAPASSSTTLTRPPVIPASVLKLVVNCLTVGECSSRTHGYTLSIMQNLSTIPDAKTTILNELRDRAQQLGQDILAELQELHKVLLDDSAELGTAALAKFSPASSSQAQLLRLLKTIDYLHSEKVDSDPPGEVLTEQEKAIAQTFDSFDFEAMWKQLSECLSTVDARGSTDQISTVLLPLVEALMVICKYRRPEARETRSPSLPPSANGETDSLFVTFTTTHRKVLNAIVRTNPGLLSGSFSLLVRNPRVLEFDNKRNWFLQKLKRKRDQPAHSPTLHLNIRRQYVFEDSFRALERRSGNEVKYGKLSVKFYNEDGIDAGGVTREWYSVLAQQIFDPNFALFEPCAADAQTYQPNKASAVNGDHLAYFKFVGRVIGKAVFDGRLLDAYFSRAFYKQILGKTVDMRDLESIDPEYHKSLQWMLDNDITDVIDQEFTIEDDQFGEKKVVELKEGGAEISVTEENKEEYVRLVVGYRVENSIKDQIKSFLNGFYEVIPRKLVQIFEPDQLELLISGITSVDVDELKNATQMSGWKPGDPEISWFWRALRSFSQEERARFLMFVTSSSRVPLGGFTQLQGASGIQPFQIQKLYSKEGSLPQASTCFNLLLLPKYETYEQLRERLQFAIYETGGFGKA